MRLETSLGAVDTFSKCKYRSILGRKMELTSHETWKGLGLCQPNMVSEDTLIYAGGN